jgi:flavodoxin
VRLAAHVAVKYIVGKMTDEDLLHQLKAASENHCLFMNRYLVNGLTEQKGRKMRKAIVYTSVHHGNTEKLVKRIAEECQVDLIDAIKQMNADLDDYDMIGFASGIYYSKFHQSILKFSEENLSADKKVFLICTYGGSANFKSIEQILNKKHASVVGKFGCKGYDTFGPFKLVGGIAKGHPDEEDMKNAVDFVKGLH